MQMLARHIILNVIDMLLANCCMDCNNLIHIISLATSVATESGQSRYPGHAGRRVKFKKSGLT